MHKIALSNLFQISIVDYAAPYDQAAFKTIINMYACDPMGGGESIEPAILERLCRDLAQIPVARSWLAWHDDKPIGLLNAFKVYSTFKGRPLMNVHDIAVHPDFRGQGVGRQLLTALEQYAKSQNCCKITLEVLTGNMPARQAYIKAGFEDYALDPAMGSACLMQKWL
jgi:GNAT superfamily N-acetyltransferase